jgi:hypothetical protein
VNDSNLFLASKELNLDDINFEESNQEEQNRQEESLFLQESIVFYCSDNFEITDEIEILFLKFNKNNIILKINLLTENIYSYIIEKELVKLKVSNKEFLIEKLSLSDDGICKITLTKCSKE